MGNTTTNMKIETWGFHTGSWGCVGCRVWSLGLLLDVEHLQGSIFPTKARFEVSDSGPPSEVRPALRRLWGYKQVPYV